MMYLVALIFLGLMRQSVAYTLPPDVWRRPSTTPPDIDYHAVSCMLLFGIGNKFKANKLVQNDPLLITFLKKDSVPTEKEFIQMYERCDGDFQLFPPHNELNAEDLKKIRTKFGDPKMLSIWTGMKVTKPPYPYY